MGDERLVVVFKAQGELQAQAVRARLESEGVPVIIQGGAPGTFPFTIDGLGEYRLLVPAMWQEIAEEIVADRSGANSDALE